MAITIDSEPSGDLFAYRPLDFQITSDSTAIIRTLADVYVDSGYVATLENSPDIGETDVFSFDIQGIVQDNLDLPALTYTTVLTNETGLNKAIQVKFYEVTTDSNGLFVTTWAEDGAGTGSVNSTTFQAINGTLPNGESNSITPYQPSGTYGHLSRTVSPIRIKADDVAVIAGVVTALPTAYAMRIKQYDSSDSLLNNGNKATGASTEHCITGRWLTSAREATTSYFTINLENQAATAITDEIRYDIVNDCNDDMVSLYWFNSVGGWDYQLFEGKKVKKVRSKTSRYEQVNTAPETAINRGDTFTNVRGAESFEAWTRPQSEERMRHLAELVTHKIDSFILENGVFIPVLITSSTSKVNDSYTGAKIFKVTLQVSNKTTSQRR